MRSFSVRTLPCIAVLAVLGVTGCDRNPAGPGVLASITVARDPDTITVGTKRQFTATGTDAEGTPVGIKPAWTVGSGGGAIDASGVFTAGQIPGTFGNTVTATVGSISGTATITVIAGPPATVAVSSPSQTLVVGATHQFTATVRDAFGNLLPVAPNWSVAKGGGSVSSAGVFTAGTVAGTYSNTVVASVGSISASATITVTAGSLAVITVAPNAVTLGTSGTQQFTATGADVNGNPVSIAPAWSVTAGGGTITNTGLFTAGSTAGTFTNTVAATIGGVIGRASVTVAAGATATITLSPTTQTLPVGATQQFTAVARDLAGNVLSVTPTWSVVAGGGTISASGLFTAGTVAGIFPNTVRVSVGAISATASVTVSAGQLATMVITPNAGNTTVGGTQQFTAAGQDASGNPVAVTPTWSVVAGGGAIGTAGLFTAGTTAGTFANSIRACSTAACAAGSVAAFASVTVSPGPLATLTVTPNPVALGASASQQFVAVGRDAGGNLVSSTAAPTWAVLAGHAGGTILSPSGLYTAPLVAGFDSVRVTIGAVSGFARVNVSLGGALASIVVTPNPSSVVAGGTSQFTATGFDATGLIVPAPGLTWSVVPAVGGGTIIGASGLFTAGSTVGTFTNAIKATSGAVAGFASVTVTAPPAAPSLGSAASFGLLSGTGLSCVSGGAVTADAGVWPGTTVTGFPPCVVSGATRIGDPVAQAAQTDFAAAFQALTALSCNTSITADLGGTTLGGGVHCSTASVGVTGTVTLNGGANTVFVIRAAAALTGAGNVVLTGGALAKNVFWVVGSTATLGTGSQWRGNVLAAGSVTLANSVALTGRALSRTGNVALGANNSVTLP